MKAQVWKIRYEGCPTNPRYRVNKHRTTKVITDHAGAEAYADSLARGLHVQILSITEVAQA